MTREKLTEGRRIAELLSSEIHGHKRNTLGRLTVVDADRDVELTADGAFAYAVAIDNADHNRVASVYVTPNRLRLEFSADGETARSTAERAGLSLRTEPTDRQDAIVFVENGAEVKAVLKVFRAVAKQRLESGD